MLFEKQEFQEHCVQNILQVLKNTDNLQDFSPLANNIKQLQQQENIALQKNYNEPRLDILMETGTGKTFTYLQTMFEMHKRFGQTKFIIFVPRLAIRAGIVQNITLTSRYFFQEYQEYLHRYIFEGNVSEVSKFIDNPAECALLILTSNSITSTNKSDRILTRVPEHSLYRGRTPIEALSALNPVVFIDEPHLLKGEKFVEVYRQYFSQSLLLRFGATFPAEPKQKKSLQKNMHAAPSHSNTSYRPVSNLVYSLDSVRAFRENLVKRIAVSTIFDSEHSLQFYPSLGVNTPLSIHFVRNGRQETAPLQLQQNISAITGDAAHNFSVRQIKGETLYLSDGTRRSLGASDYTLSDSTIRTMIRQTIKLHFEKEERNFTKGLKTLSLFFIPHISDFRGENPRIYNIFVDVYAELHQKQLKSTTNPNYAQYLQRDYADGEIRVHEGYFSGDRIPSDALKGSSKDVQEYNAVNLILKNKTELLSLNNPLRFIFSVWALQEGWDNPNIFTICKLAATDKEIKRRQQIGRGLRIAVNQNGKRLTQEYCSKHSYNFDSVNELDIVVSADEKNYIEGIQHEINEQFRNASTISIINRNEQSDTVGIRAHKFREFEELWKTITQKAQIEYKPMQEGALIQRIQAIFNNENIPPVSVTVVKKSYNHHTNEIESRSEETLGTVEYFKQENFAAYIHAFAKREQLSLAFCQRVFWGLNRQYFINNPSLAQTRLTSIIKEEIHRSIVQTVGYNFTGKVSIQQSVFYEEDAQTPKTSIETGKLGKYTSKDSEGRPKESAEHYLYENYVYDSQVELNAMQQDSPVMLLSQFGETTIQVFAKLPRISIPTPYKTYNPDFAYYIQNDKGKQLFLVVETKGYNSKQDIPEKERKKTEYAKKFFEKLNETTKHVNIKFVTRVSLQNLRDILNEIGGLN